MKMRNVIKVVWAMAAMGLAVACGGRRAVEPSAEFSSYIKAYTGGVISTESVVRIEFAADMRAVEDESLFSFSPGLKGSVQWMSPTVVEFVPDAGQLRPGAQYKAVFRLGEVTSLKNKNLDKFVFSFIVAPKTAELAVDGVRITAEEPGVASVSGRVVFSEPVAEKDVAQMLTAGGTEKAEWQSEPGGRAFTFVFKDIERGEKDKDFEMSFNPSKKGFKGESKCGLVIPGTSEFKVISAVLHESGEPFIDVRFSEALAPEVEEVGFFEVEGAGRCFVRTDGNRARVFFDGMPQSGSVKLRVAEMVGSRGGAKLAAAYENTFNSSAIKPEVRFSFNGNILPDASNLILPFRAIGLRAVDVSVIKIYENNVLMFLQDNDLDDGQEIRRSGRLVFHDQVYLDGDASKDIHRWEEYSIDLSRLLRQEPGAIYRIRLSFNYDYSVYAGYSGPAQAKDPSLVLLSSGSLTQQERDVWDTPYPYYYEDFYDWNEYNWDDRDDPTKPSYYMDSDRFPQVNILTSTVGIIAKASDADRVWVSVSDIMSTRPMSGAEVVAYNFQLQEVGRGKTDNNGFTDFRTTSKPFVLVARKDKAVGYLKMEAGAEKSLSRFDTGGSVLSSGLKAFIYGERGVWRPGDTLHVSLMVEDREKIIPASHPVTMEMYTPEGQFHSKLISTGSARGLYVFNIPTYDSDPTGTWNAWFKVGGASFHKSFHIETVKANRLKINMDIKDEILKSGVSVPVSINAKWLTGPDASGLHAVTELTLSKTSTTFPKYEGWTFCDPLHDFTSSTCTILDGILDEDGNTGADVVMPGAPAAPGLLKATLVTRVMEPGGDASITTRTMPFAPYDAFVGVKLPEENNLETDKDNDFPVIVLDAAGKAVTGHELEYRICKLDWSWWWESGAEALDSYVNGSSAEPVAQGKFTSGLQPYHIKFRVDYPEWGRYLIYVKDVTGGHATGGTVVIDWPTWRGRADRSDPDGLTMLTFNTDKSSYEVGEEVSVYIPSAESGRALVSLENGRGVISRSWVRTVAGQDAQYKFTVSPDMAPNFYIHITMLQNYKRERNDLPIRLYGVQPVQVSNKSSHLTPVLTLPEVIRPQEEFTVKVKEQNGKPMSYTIAIVDEGLLDLTGFKTPDPWSAMYTREALGVRTWDMYDNVIGAFSGRFAPLMSIGGDEDFTLDNRKDSRFNPVVKFYGPFTLERGTATHKFTLPMYVGSVRVMVVAGRDGAYGKADKPVPVRTPLMILPTLPRILGTGEEVVLPVNVFAMENNIKAANVKVTAEGPVTVSSAASASLTFDKPSDKLAFFTLTTGKVEGVAKVTVTAESGTYKLKETISIKVRNPNPPVSASESSLVQSGKSVSFSFEPFHTDVDHWAKVQLSNFPAIDFDGLFSYIQNYAYDCTEQLSAKGMTLVYLKPLLSTANAALADGLIESTLQSLYSRQLPDGGFAYWPGQAVADEWVTSMAGQFLTEASSMGFSVDKGVINSWKKFQRKAAQNYQHNSLYTSYDLIQAYRLYTLAVAGSSDDGAMNRLKAAPQMTAQARWRLAAAYAAAGRKNVAKSLLETLDTDLPDSTPGRYTYGTEKDKAMLLETAVLINEIPLAMSLAQEVAAAIGRRGTEASAFAALAMNRLSKKVGDSAIDVEFRAAKSGSIKTAKSSVCADIDPSSGSLDLRNLSSGPVYVSFQRRMPVPAVRRVEESSSNIALSVRYYDLAGNEIAPGRLRQGQDFRARLIVSNPSPEARTGLALTQVVPSGWEIFNERLYNSAAQQSEECAYKDIRDDRVIWYFDLPAGGKKVFEVRLQAAYAGTFVLPAVTCEAMYDPQTYANTASGTSTVEQ